MAETKKKVSKKTKKLIINIAVLAALTGITLMILMLSYRELDFSDIWTFLGNSNWGYIAAAIGCMLLFILFEGLALFVISRRLGHKTKIKGAMAYSSADIYYSALTPSASGGQPASMFYMVRDGMSGGIAGFSLVFNLMAYTSAIIIMGLFAFIARPGIFGVIGHGFAQTLVIIGFVLQCFLLGFFMTCIFWSKAILKMGNAGIKLLNKMHIIKKPDKWYKKWKAGVEKYKASRDIIREHPTLFLDAIVLNLAQRVSQTMIPCFVCLAASSNASVIDLFCMQCFVLLGYNMVPIPGGVGAYEYLYLTTYGAKFSESFIMSAMMVSRAISYYICLIVSGVYTLLYHSFGIKGKKPESPEAPPEPDEDWKWKMYTEGERWCEDDYKPHSHAQTYSEGEATHHDDIITEPPDEWKEFVESEESGGPSSGADAPPSPEGEGSKESGESGGPGTQSPDLGESGADADN